MNANVKKLSLCSVPHAPPTIHHMPLLLLLSPPRRRRSILSSARALGLWLLRFPLIGLVVTAEATVTAGTFGRTSKVSARCVPARFRWWRDTVAAFADTGAAERTGNVATRSTGGSSFLGSGSLGLGWFLRRRRGSSTLTFTTSAAVSKGARNITARLAFRLAIGRRRRRSLGVEWTTWTPASNAVSGCGGPGASSGTLGPLALEAFFDFPFSLTLTLGNFVCFSV